LDVGNWGRFIPEGRGLSSVNLRVVSIDRDASRVLTEGVLASTAGGEILVRQLDKKMVPERAIYRVRLQVMGDQDNISNVFLRGRVTMLAWPKSMLGDFLNGLFTTLLREITF
jgi:putative peptide zinc metalloprotease protein